MINGLDVNYRYLQHITQAMDAITDDGRLALYSKERDEQEKYFDRFEEPDEDLGK